MSVEDGIPEEGQATEATQDWEKDYKALQAEYTRNQQTLKSFESDPNALISFIQEKHPDLLVGDDEEEETEEPFVDPDEDEQPLTKAEWKAWQAEQAQQSRATAAQTQFETDFTKFVGDRELSPQGNAAVRFAATKGEIKGPDDLKKAVDDWFTYEDDLRGPKAKPRAPHVPANGSAATDVPNWDEMTPGEINKYLTERVAGHQAQT